MSRILVTGGTAFVSRYIASYLSKTNEVCVLNRGTHPQESGVTLIQADRHALGDALRGMRFDAVIDVCAYTADDVNSLLDALDFTCGTPDYVLISSSAVYPENTLMHAAEDAPTGPNAVWGTYGTNKIAAEQAAFRRLPNAYVLRPPYLYGPMQNVYREPFVFDCAMQGRTFAIPGDGGMPLQFFHVEDLCRVIEAVLARHPADHVLNVGNPETVTVNEFVRLCYEAAGRPLRTVEIHHHPNQRDYFPFHDYAYSLDVTRMQRLLPKTVDLADGLRQSFAWHAAHPDDVRRKPYADFIDAHLCR